MIKALALAAILGSQAAAPPPAPPGCLTRQQAGDLAVVVGAIFVESARNACRPHLAPGAFLGQPASAEYSARLREEARHRFASAADGIGRASAAADAGPMAMVRTMMSTMLAEGVGGEFTAMVDAPICRDVNDLVEVMSALPPDQIARFSSATMSLASQFAARMPPPAPPPPPAARAGRRPRANAAAPPPPRPRPPILCPE
jgi:hypothetical protein